MQDCSSCPHRDYCIPDECADMRKETSSVGADNVSN